MSGHGYKQGMSLTFDPPLTFGEDYSITFSSTENQVILQLKSGKKWRSEPGLLKLKSITFNGQITSMPGGGTHVATVLADPVVYRTIDLYHESQSKRIAITGSGFTNLADTKVTIRPTAPGAYKIVTVLEDVIILQLKPENTWLPMSLKGEDDAKKIAIWISSIDTGAGEVTFPEPIIVGYFHKDIAGVTCDDSCEFAFNGVCDDGSESVAYNDYYMEKGGYFINGCVRGTDCTDCGGVDAIVAANSATRPPSKKPTARPTVKSSPVHVAFPTRPPVSKQPVYKPVGYPSRLPIRSPSLAPHSVGPTKKPFRPSGKTHTPVIILSAVNFTSYLADKYAIVHFYAPWAIWCQRLEPVWDDFNNALQDARSPVVVAKVDCIVNRDLCTTQRIQAFPQISAFNHGITFTADKYGSDRTVEALMAFVRSRLIAYGYSTCTNTCIYPRDGVCDDPRGTKYCELGTDCQDCGWVGFDNFTRSDDDGWWDDSTGKPSSRPVAKVTSRPSSRRPTQRPTSRHPTQRPTLRPSSRPVAHPTPRPPTAGPTITQFSLSLSDRTFAQHLATHSFVFVRFYAPWDTSYHSLDPVWQDVAHTLKMTHPEVSVVQVDCTKYLSVCETEYAEIMPTLRMYSKFPLDREVYTKERTKEALLSYVQNYVTATRLPTAWPTVNSGVRGTISLTEKTFAQHIASYNFVFVRYYAQWDVSYKTLGPIWDTLSRTVTSQGILVSIVMVDCPNNAKLCPQEVARSFPTLKMYVKGQPLEDYSGVRTMEAMLEYCRTTAAHSTSSGHVGDDDDTATTSNKKSAGMSNTLLFGILFMVSMIVLFVGVFLYIKWRKGELKTGMYVLVQEFELPVRMIAPFDVTE
eukprot:gene23822-30094_t